MRMLFLPGEIMASYRPKVLCFIPHPIQTPANSVAGDGFHGPLRGNSLLGLFWDGQLSEFEIIALS